MPMEPAWIAGQGCHSSAGAPGKYCATNTGATPCTINPRATPSRLPNVPSARACSAKNTHDLPRLRADALHDGDRVEPLLDVRVHCRRHPEAADDHGDQADQAEEVDGAVKAAADGRMRLAKVRDPRSGQALAQRLPRFLDREALGRQLEQEPLRSAAARLHQARAVERLCRKHDSRPYVHAARHAVGLDGQNSRDAELFVAQAHGIADLDAQPQQQVVRNDDACGGQGRAQFLRRSELDLSVERVARRVNGLDRDQQRARRGRTAHHRRRFDDAGKRRSARNQIVERLPLVGAGLVEDARADVRGHQDAGVAQQHLSKRRAKAANPAEHAYAERHREHDENELARGCPRLAPSDLRGRTP